MKALTITLHGMQRMGQRNIRLGDEQLIAQIGAEVPDGYIVLDKDFQRIEREVKQWLARIRRLVGKRIVLSDGRIVTAYQSSDRKSDTSYARRVKRASKTGGIVELVILFPSRAV